MYLVLDYDQEPPKTILRSGEYFKLNHGGASEWFIVEEKPEESEKYIAVLEYHNEKYFYDLHFYGKLEGPLWDIFAPYLNATNCIFRWLNDERSIILTNIEIKFDEEIEYQEGFAEKVTLFF
jgi:hypothetical protein